MATDTNKETRDFQSEVKQLLGLVINSLYSNREIFLRELISNSSDAIDKLRFNALSDDSLYEGDAELVIDVDFDADAKTITVRDNGIGMSRQEVVENLGTIARSGTKEFFGAMQDDARDQSELIGQFGVGFYAAFIVAERVTVNTRRAGDASDQGVRWVSEGKGEFSVENVERVQRGTEVTLHLKEDAHEFVDAYRLRGIIKKYSDHLSTPIRMSKPDEKEEGVEVVNNTQALWTRGKQELSDDDYKSFYKHISHDFEDPLTWIHNKVEGTNEYITLLYLPSRPPFDLFDRDVKHGVKLYVQRVFIMDGAEELMPRYLRFIRGIVDASDLPLNVSREILQKNKLIDTIRSASVKRVLTLLEDLAKGDDYAKFWQNFGRVLKEGVVEDFANQERIAKLLRFASTRDENTDAAVSLQDYRERMGEAQAAIYYLTAETLSTARSSPHLEVFRDKNIEVLLLTDPVDEWVATHLTEFDGKPLKSVLHGNLDLEKDDADTDGEDAQAEQESWLKRFEGALDGKVKSVRASKRLTNSPACLVSDEHDMSANLQRILKSTGQEVPATQRILEINPTHPLVTRVNDESDEDRYGDWATMLYEQALLAEGGRLDDPAGFVQRMNDMLLELSER